MCVIMAAKISFAKLKVNVNPVFWQFFAKIVAKL